MVTVKVGLNTIVTGTFATVDRAIQAAEASSDSIPENYQVFVNGIEVSEDTPLADGQVLELRQTACEKK